MNHYGDYFGMEEAWEQDLPNKNKRTNATTQTPVVVVDGIGCNTMTNHYGDYFGLELDEIIQQKETMKRIASDPSPDWAAAVQATENLPTTTAARSQK